MKGLPSPLVDFETIDAPAAGDRALWLHMAALDEQDPRIMAFEHLPMPMLIMARGGTIVACNVAAADLIGDAASAVVNRPLWTVLRPRYGAESVGATKPCTLTNGRGERPVLVERLGLVQGGNGASLLLLREPTADEAEGAQGSEFLLDMVAHELRSLLLSLNLSLAGLTGFTETMQRDGQRLLGTLHRSAAHLQMLLENLLDASTLRSDRFSIDRRETDMTEVITEAVLAVEPLLGPSGQQVELDLPPEPLPLSADPQHLRQILVNLLHNAIKYGPPGETIGVRASCMGCVLQVEVHDSGPGIPLDEQPLLFERFYRGQAARRVGHGSGLGLAIAKAIVEAHGGQIGVRSAPEHGTTFWFIVPVA